MLYFTKMYSNFHLFIYQEYKYENYQSIAKPSSLMGLWNVDTIMAPWVTNYITLRVKILYQLKSTNNYVYELC